MRDRNGDSVTGILPPLGADELADKIRDALGATPDEKINFTTPQFIRPAGEPVPAMAVRDREWWNDLRLMDKIALKELGMRAWDAVEDDVLMLFPGEWYDQIPTGYSIVSISGSTKSFDPGVTDSDIRFGCLPYGIIASKGESK